MARAIGTTGAVEVPDNTEIGGIKSWTLDITADAVETTGFDSSGVRSYLGTVFGWSGSFEGYKDGVCIVVEGSSTTIQLSETTPVDEVLWSGAVIITGLTVGHTHDGVCTVNYTFQGTGTLTEAAS